MAKDRDAPEDDYDTEETLEEEESLDMEEDDEVLPNGGTAIIEASVPSTMRRYVAALQRTPPERDLGAVEEDAEAVSDEAFRERSVEIERLAIEPEDLKEIQETFHVHSIEEILETLKMREEELIRIKSDFSIKMRNSLALQRIKFEKELSDMKKRMEEYAEFTKADDYLKKKQEELQRKERVIDQKEEELKELRDEVETLRSTPSIADGETVIESRDIAELREIIDEQALEVSQIESKLSKARTEIEEVQAEVETEKRRRGEAEGELDNLKKGSIAMMKYVTSMQKKKAEEELTDLRRGIEEERRRREELDEELSKKDTALKARDVDFDEAISDAVVQGAKGMDLETIAKLNQEMRVRQSAIEAKEKDLKLKERKIVAQLRKLKDERDRMKAAEREALDDQMQQLPDFQEQLLNKDDKLRDYRAQIDVLNDELSKLKKAVDFKEDEVSRRKEELDYKEKLLVEETAKLKEAKEVAGGSEEVLDAKKEVDRLEKVIGQKENELRTKEAFLANKERELQIKEQAVIQDNLKVAAQEREAEMEAQKIKSGTGRLDDLLFGGLPLGSNVIVKGPPFIGKEILLERFIVEGITKGVPTVLVLTDLRPLDMRTALSNHIPAVEEYERLGLLKYIDAYSIPMGIELEEDKDNPNIIYVEEATAYKKIIDAMDKLIKAFKKKGYDYFRVAVISISTFITYSDVKATAGFLQSLTGKLKRTEAVSLYSIDEGMHSQTDIMMLGHVMDGSFQFKAENLKTYISIQGVCDTQSRDWIQYQYTKKGLNIGSFTLTHIR